MTPAVAHFFRSLRHRDFRKYFIGHSISVCGVWMQNVAQAWLVYRLSESSFLLGLVSFFAMSPMLLFGLIGGGLADRYSPYRLLLLSQSLAMLQAFVLAGLALGGWIEVWHIMCLAFFLGLTQAVQIPARHAFLAGVVPREDLANAVALNSGAFNTARFLGPAAAGGLVLVADEGIVFLINGLSFVLYLAVMLGIESPRPARGGERPGLRAGLTHAWHNARIRAGLLMVGIVSLTGTVYLVLMPVFARDVFGGGPDTLGLLLGAAGGGSLLGALSLAHRSGSAGLDRSIGVSGILGSLSLIAFSRAESAGLAMLILPVAGFALTRAVVSTNALIQLLVSDDMRGRVMSLFTVTFLGLAPIGNLLAGALGEFAGAAPTVTGYAIVYGIAAAVFLYLTRQHPAADARDLPQRSQRTQRE